MKCPTCNVNLAMSERQGVEIDYCPECRGVWLDRGELDKIIEKSNQDSSGTSGTYNDAPRVSYGEEKYHHETKRDNNIHNNYKKKRGGLLGDLFDFGD